MQRSDPKSRERRPRRGNVLSASGDSAGKEAADGKSGRGEAIDFLHVILGWEICFLIF